MAQRTKVFVDIITRSDGKEPGAGLKKFAIGAGVAAVAIAGLIKIGKDLVNIYSVQEQAEARLEQTVKATGKAAGLSADQLFDMASGLQEVTKFGDEAIIGAESLLLTFKDIGEDIFPRALESILDVSEAMGTDLQSSTIQLGKALNDPILGLTSLSRAGIQFTDTQKELIKSLVETGDKAAAQTIILEELESQFGGVARAAADTATGSMVQMKNSIGDVQEAYGNLIANGLEPFAKAITAQTSALASYLNSLNESRDILKLINEGALDSGKSLEDLTKILTDLETKRDISRGQVSKGLLEEIRVIEILIDTYGTQDLFLTKAADTALVLARVKIDSDLREVELQNLKIIAGETLADITAVELTEKEKELKLLQDQINFWSELRDTVEGAEELFQELASQRNDLLKEGINIQKELAEVIINVSDVEALRHAEAMIGIGREAEAITELKASWLDYANSTLGLLGAIASFQSANAAAELQQLEESGASQEELDTLKRKIAHDEAVRKKQLGIFSVIVDTAAGIAEAIPNPFLIALAAITGAIQLAAVNAAPIPSLATGGQFITDGPTLIGDNASGQERITVEPLGGGNNGRTSEKITLIIDGQSFWGVMQRGVDNRKIHSSLGGPI